MRCGNGVAVAAQDRTFGVVCRARVAVGRPRASPTAVHKGISILLASLVGLCLWAQDVKTPAEFLGRWEATFQKTVFLILRITADGGISGTLRSGSISLNEDGDLTQAGPVSRKTDAIKNAKLDGATLLFDLQDAGDDEVTKFELKITGEDAGLLRIVDEHVPKMKGFDINRTAR